MVKIAFILVAFGTFITCFGDTIQDDDWKNKGFYRPRRNYQTQSQIRNSPQPSSQNNRFGDTIPDDDGKNKEFYRPRRNYQTQTQIRSSPQPWSQINHNLNATRETRFGQSLENQKTQNYNPNHQRTNAFGASNSRNVQDQNLFQRTSYNHDSQNAFRSNTDSLRTNFNQNNQRQNSFATSYSQSQDKIPFVNQHFVNQNSFGNSYDLRNQNQDLIGAGNSQTSHNSNLFQTSIRENHPNQNLFGSANQNFQRQNSFGSSFGQNAFSHQNFGSNHQQIANSGSFDSFNENTFKGYDYLPPRDKLKPPFVGPTYLPPITDKPLVTITKRPFPTYHGTGTNDASPAMAMLVPPEPEDEPTPSTTVVVTTLSTTTTTTTSQPLFDRESSEIFPETMTTTKRPPIFLPAMAMSVPPEPEDDPTPTTTPSTTTPTTTTTTTTTPSTTTSTPSTTTPEPNRSLIEETSPTTTTTKRPIITTPTTTTTTKIVTTPTSPTTPYFKAPEYLPPEPPRIGPPPKPAMAMPVVLECDPSDPNTYLPGIDPRFTGGDPCNPTTTTPEPIPSEEPTTPTTTTRIVTTSTTPTTRYFTAPEDLPPTTPRKVPPSAPARAMPVVPECDPSDPSTYPPNIDLRYNAGDPCNPTTTTPEPNRSGEPTTPTTTTRIVTTSTTPTPHFKAPEYLPPLNMTKLPPGPAPARAMPVVPECDPSDPSTYPPNIDLRYNAGDPCNPTTTTPEPNRSGEPTTPTTTTRIVTTSTTPHFKAPEYLPPLNMTKLPPGPAPARAMPVPEPECDPSDPSTYPLGANPCTVPPSCIAPSFLPQGPKKRVARAINSGRTLRLADLTGIPRPVWYVGIYDKTYTPRYKPICGGSVLTMDVVISAGHCFWGDDSLLPAADFAVGANKIFRPWEDKMDKKAQKSDVKELIVPPRFRGVKTSFQDDIAILKLVTPFKYALGLRPLCVDLDEDFEEKQLKEGHSGTFAGWGATDAAGTPTGRLLWLELPFVQIDRCIAGYPDDFVKYITSDKMCAGETNTGKALCGGDSGGGLVFWHGEPHNAVPYLRGIASTAPKADLQECNVQVVGTFTQISWHRRFLREHVPGLGDECHFRN